MRFFRAWDSALPAADFESLDDRPSRSVADDFFAAFADVFLLGDFRCDSALPAALFDLGEVLRPWRVFDALDAAFLPVSFDMSGSELRIPDEFASAVPSR
ncbi:MAG: hypothetical protein H0W68_14780 [Gemmatimonadaceae bacterium]|nr:hypothetical protein [Gemmatimonadaceae bacterium]